MVVRAPDVDRAVVARGRSCGRGRRCPRRSRSTRRSSGAARGPCRRRARSCAARARRRARRRRRRAARSRPRSPRPRAAPAPRRTRPCARGSARAWRARRPASARCRAAPAPRDRLRPRPRSARASSRHVLAAVTVLRRLLAAGARPDRLAEALAPGCPRRSRSTRARRGGRHARGCARASRRTPRGAPDAIVIGPVGFALTNSTFRCSPPLPAPYRRRPRAASASVSRYQLSAMNRLRKPGPGDLHALDRFAQPLAEPVAEPLGHRARRLAERRAPAASPRWSSSRRSRHAAAGRASAPRGGRCRPARRRSPRLRWSGSRRGPCHY